ncbi:hypothetical protein N7535_003348 [Penicillium sp. DV-2018c]|nr:hypothetical protein N7461_000957 [Penicillium sp. DV-2018c]KAJ5576422.1 hypothetical protein N7535_003348 [Penicillium sp. DV-2018c]
MHPIIFLVMLLLSFTLAAPITTTSEDSTAAPAMPASEDSLAASVMPTSESSMAAPVTAASEDPLGSMDSMKDYDGKPLIPALDDLIQKAEDGQKGQPTTEEPEKDMSIVSSS